MKVFRMSFLFSLSLLLLFVAVLSLGAQNQAADEVLQRQILGKWTENVPPYGVAAFEEGGVYRAFAYEGPNKATLTGTAKGKWWIKDGKLYSTVHEITPPSPSADPEKVFVDKIIDISATILTLIDKDGSRYTLDRVKE